MKKLVFVTGTILVTLFSAIVFSKPNKDSEALIASFDKYRKAGEIEFHVEKIVKQIALGKETIYEGKLFISRGKFRFEVESPEKSLLLYDGHFFWNVDYPSENPKEPPQISKAKVNRAQNGNILFTLLFGEKSLDAAFKIELQEAVDGFKLYKLASKKEIGVKDLIVKITDGSALLEKISFIDDIGNQTSLSFSKTKIISKSNFKRYIMNIPKGVRVTEL